MAAPLIPITIGAGAAAAAGIALLFRRRTRRRRSDPEQPPERGEPVEHRAQAVILSKAWRLVKGQNLADNDAPTKLCPREQCMMFKSKSWNNLYVVRLDQRVWREKPRFKRENPHYKPSSRLPCVYVGTTAHEPSCRFQQHLAGHNAGRGFVTDYGKRLLPESEYDLKDEFPRNPIPAYPLPTRSAPNQTCAHRLEALLARWLQGKGWAVWSK